jgi:hypothetical protein
MMRVRVEDVSHADRRAEVVAEHVQSLDTPLREGAELPFSLDVPELDPRRRYGVRVHVGTTGSADVMEGDLISTQSYAVLTFGHPDHVRVEVRKI